DRNAYWRWIAFKLPITNYKLQMTPRFRPGMMFRIHALQPIQRHVGINLCSRNVGVPEDGLHRPEIGPILHHMRSAGVPQHVRTGVSSGSETRLPHQLPESLPSQAASRAQEKERRAFLLLRSSNCFPPVFQVALERLLGRTSERHHALLVALAAHQYVSHFQFQVFEP